MIYAPLFVGLTVAIWLSREERAWKATMSGIIWAFVLFVLVAEYLFS